MAPLCPSFEPKEYNEFAAESGSCELFGPLRMSAKLNCDEAFVDDDMFGLLAPKLFDLDRALSSLLPSLLDFADSPPPMCSGGNRPLDVALSSSRGIPLLPIGVANASFGGFDLGISRGGTAWEGCWTALALGDGGMERPSFGMRAELAFLLPGIGGLNSGAGNAMLKAWGGEAGYLLSSATMGNEGRDWDVPLLF